jgi:PAS domain S-box-containing protein
MNDLRRTKDQLIKELGALRRKAASLEKKLKGNPAVTHWQNTFDALNDAVCILDQKGVILRCNRTTKTLFKKPFSKLIGKKCWGVVYGTSKNVEECSFARMLKTGRRESTEKQMKDRWFRITTDPIKNKNGQLLGAVYVITDITRMKQMELSLHESQQLYARAEQIGNFGHWNRDYIAGKANWSAGMYHLFGIRPEEFRSDFDFFLDLVDPADIEHLRKSIEAAMSTHTPLDVEYRIRRPDGKERLIHSTAEILFGEGNQAVGLFGICQDITEHRRAEATLRESEKRFSTIFHFSPVSIAITRLRDNQLIDVNEAWQEITGFTREEVIGRTATALNLWPDQEERFRLMTALGEQGLVRGFEVLICQKSGKKIHLLFSAGLITVAGEQCMVSMALDITGRIEMEEALRENEEKYRLLFNAESDAVMVFDGESRKLIDMNNAAVQLYGYGHEEFLGMFLEDISAEPDKSEKSVQQILAGEITKIPLRYHRKKDGTIFPVEVSAGLFIMNERKIVIGAVREISERIKAEEKIKTYHKRLSELASQIALIAEDERRRFADELHDLTGQNLALAKIKLSELRDSVPDKEIQGRLDELSRLVEEAASSTRSLTFELSPPILYEIGFEATAEWLGEQILRKYNIAFLFDNDMQPKPLSDETKVLLFVSLRELIVNVAKHSKALNATVALRREGNMLYVSVSDDGIGFDASTLDFQIMKATSFGLFSTRERVERLGGHLIIASLPGKGTTVTMVVPLKE